MITMTASKYIGGCTPAAWNGAGHSVAIPESTKAAPVPTAIRVFMSATRCRNACQARR